MRVNERSPGAAGATSGREGQARPSAVQRHRRVAGGGAGRLATTVRRLVGAAGAVVLTGFLGIPLTFAPDDAPSAGAADAAGIPPNALAAYRRVAASCPGLRWEVLAGIGQVESGHGTSADATVGSHGVSAPPILGPPLDGTGDGGNATAMPAGRWAGRWGVRGPWLQAVGPMQLLPPTFEAWAVDGDGDGRRDPHDIDDAVATAAAYLCGGQRRIVDERAALLRYNRSTPYVEEVLGWAARYAAAPPLVVDQAGSAALLANGNVTVYADGRSDLASGRVDARVAAVLLALARDHSLAVTSLVTGHPRCAVNGQPQGPGCAVSNHYLGRAVDIAVLDAVAVSARHPGVVAVMGQLADLPSPFRPDEIGGPVDTGQPGVFTNAFHADHIHFGWDR